jgi:hypothetical protein
MDRNWSLRHLFANTRDSAAEQDPVKARTSSMGRVRFGDFKINLDTSGA